MNKTYNDNNSKENSHLNPKSTKSCTKHNNKQNLYKKNIIENNKIGILSLSKYINKSNNSMRINNIKTNKCKHLKSQNININKLVNRNESHTHNINNIFINYNNNNNIIPEKNIENTRYESNIDKVGNTFDKKVTNYYYCFSDNKFRNIKGLKKDKLLHYFKKDSHFNDNQTNKFISNNFKNNEEPNNVCDSKIIDYIYNCNFFFFIIYFIIYLLPHYLFYIYTEINWSIYFEEVGFIQFLNLFGLIISVFDYI